MKRRRIVLALGMSMVLLMTGCSGAKTDKSSDETQNSENTQDKQMDQGIFGQVTEVGEDYIVIEKTERPKAQEKSDVDSENKASSEEAESEEETGEKQQIKIDAETVIKRGGMGMRGGKRPDGNPPQQAEGSEPSQSEGEESPQKPEGEQGQQPDGEQGQQPDREQGQQPDGEQPPQKPDGEGTQMQETEGARPQQSGEEDSAEGSEEEITISDISTGDQVSVILGDDGTADEIRVMQGGAPGQAQEVENYNAVEEYDEDTEKSSETIASAGTDENAVHILNGAEVSLKNMTVTRTSQDSKGGDEASFFGVGAAVLATDGTAYISNSDIQTEAAGGAGIFSYGDGVIYAADTKIDTKKDTSGGIHAAGGGTLYAWNLDAETSGESAAAIRSDRGGGKMVIDGESISLTERALLPFTVRQTLLSMMQSLVQLARRQSVLKD